MKNNKGIALFLAIGFVAITAAVILGVGILLNSYRTTSTSYKEKEYSIHYANLALEEIKWNLEKRYKDWMYDATHNPGSDGYYDYDPRATGGDDNLLDGSVNPDTDDYSYTAVSTEGFSDTNYQESYWIKVIDHYVWQEEDSNDIYSKSSSKSIPYGRAEGWIRVAQDSEDAASKFTFIYDVFCRGVSYRGVDMVEQDGEYVYSGNGKPPRETLIQATAKAGDSLSLSEFSISVFKGHLNVGRGYNGYGRMHAQNYIKFIDQPSDRIGEIPKFYNVLSTSNADGADGFIFQRQADVNQIAPSEWETWVSNHKDDTITTKDGTTVSTWGFDKSPKLAHAAFVGDFAEPAIIPPISPKTDMHFRKVRGAARANGIFVEEGNVGYMFLDPGDVTVNGDGAVVIYLDSGTLYVNGEAQSGGSPYTIQISDLDNKLVYVDGAPLSASYPISSCVDEGTRSYTYGNSTDMGIYTTSGIRGLAGVLDGQLSIFSGYDIVLAGDIIYQNFLDKINFTYKDYSGGTTYGEIKQWALVSSPGVPSNNNPNLLGVNGKHDIIVPGDMFNWASDYSYNGFKADRCDQSGTGIISSGSISGDGYPDLFTFGLYFGAHRVYGEVPVVTPEETYDRSKKYVDSKGTWFIYGGLGSAQQIYASLSYSSPGMGHDEGYAYRSYNYDPNLYNYEPPFTIAVTSQPIWNWRIVNNFPQGIEPK
ncbi:MAG: hypothetical protein FXF47_02225 [Candidatus Mcinerneyibacterium aminivorans]|uniref:Uncharacterized protein n=1 Tax=Candidatus Mcinerneyibacterium aminivorans TaxID=2703815 RepID=A0A5D0MFL5_9BACT|nr:MAG: hypothetical protein FXF47_02225 [Candidatus Mcinerneyibacterium aminivorans]